MRVLVACEYSGRVRDAFAALGHEAWSCDLLPTDAPGLHYQGDVTKLLDGWVPARFTADCDPDGDGWCQQTDQDPGECKCYGPTQDGMEYQEVDGELFVRPERHPHWDLMIAHPPCTYLTIAAEWAYADPNFDKYPNGGYHQKLKPGTLTGAARRAAREESIAFVRLLMNAPIHSIAIENPIGCLSRVIRKPEQIIQPWQFGADASKQTCLWLKNLCELTPTEIIAPRLVNGRKLWANQTDTGQNRLSPSEDRWKERSKTYPGIAAAMADQWGS